MSSKSIAVGALIASALLPFAFLACTDDDTKSTTPTPTPDASATAPPADGGGPPADSGGDAATDAGPSGKSVTIAFAGKVGADPWSCTKTYPGLGATAVTVEPKDLRFYVHDVRLVRADDVEVPLALAVDGKWQTAEVALVDLEDGTGTCTDGTPDTNAAVKGTVPEGTYKGLAFKVGVPFAKNHGNPTTAPSPLNLTQMLWSWQAGYRFVKIDTQPVGGAGPMPRFNLHLGSTDCVGDPEKGVAVTSCGRPNRFEVKLATFDAATQKVVLDYAALVAGVDMSQNGGGPPGCMSGTTDPECGPLFPKLGLDFTSGAPSGTQSVFKAE